MKINLLVLNDFTNDARVHKEAKSLAQAGHKVTVVALWRAGLEVDEQHARYHVHRVHLATRAWRGSLIAPVVKYLEFTYKFRDWAKITPADVYHANDANTLPAAWLASRQFGSALVYDAHELETGRDFGNSRLSRIYPLIWAWPEKLFIRSADAVITVSSGIAEEISRIYHIPVPDVVLNTPEQIQLPKVRPNKIREELGIPAEINIALYQGHIYSGRGLENFFYAIQSLKNVCAVALGEGPMLESFRLQVNQGDWKRVYLPGKVPLDKLLNYTASADVGLVLIENTCLSHYYSLPNKLFEYMHAGIPVIGSDLPEISRMILENKIGQVVNPNKPDEISKSIQNILSDDSTYEAYVANCVQASHSYNWENESNKLVGLYLKLEQRSNSAHIREKK